MRTSLRFSVALAAALLAGEPSAQSFYKRKPNNYTRTSDDNVATRLDARLASGEVTLPATGPSGRLLPLLEALDVPVSSQTIVFSKTSLQRHRVSPHNPRALYFNSDVYVGFIPDAKSLELIVGDDRLGLAFYRVPQTNDAPVRITRDDTCLSCHASARTRNEPGLLLRSVFPDENGDPIASAGETEMDFRAPIEERWGGWLLTGVFRGPHRGNGIAQRGEFDDNWRVEPRPAADLSAFADRFDCSAYPVRTSDIGALLALEQQVAVHNLLVRAALQVRYLLEKDRVVNDMLGEDGMRASTERIVDGLARDIAAALLLDGEASLAGRSAAPLAEFARDFASQWPQDERGCQLGVLDLKTRTFTLPMSPMIHSPAFARLPAELRQRVLRRLAVAVERGVPPGNVRFDRATRTALRDHLRATIPDWPRRKR